MRARLVIAPSLASVLGLLACGDPDPAAPDAPPAPIDAAALDAEPDAAPGPCPGEAVFTGGYEDWDSQPGAFLGVFEATVAEVGDATNTATTAPNGRSTLCLPGSGVSHVRYTHASYLPAVYTFDPAAQLAPYTAHGITPARLTSQYAAIGGGLTVDADAAPVAIEVRSFPSGDPIDGVTLALEGATAGFHRDADYDFQDGATTAGGADVLFANVDPGDGALALTVTPPAGVTCHAPAELSVTAGELTLATVGCED